MGRFENFTPPTLGSELTSSEIELVEELNVLANSASGEFLHKESGSFVNSTLSETIAFSGLFDVVITSVAQGDLIYYNGSAWVNLVTGISGQVLTSGGSGELPTWQTISTTVTGASIAAHFQTDVFTGDGLTNVFTASQPVVATIYAMANDQPLTPTTEYSATATQLTVSAYTAEQLNNLKIVWVYIY